jgi:hypothetical protein
MATALKLKNDINKLKAALRSKATPKSFIPKLKSQLDKAEADYESVKAGKKSAPKAGKQVKSTMDKLKAIIKKKKYGAYRAQGVDLKKDADRPALPTGKRISKNGNTYYEYRANRIDVKQPPKRYPKLADGGFVSKGEKVWNKISNSEKMEFLKENFTPEITPRSQEGLVGKSYKFLPRNVKIKFEAKYANVEEYAKGGYMADGGKTTVVDDFGSMSFRNQYDEWEMVVVSKELEKDGGRFHKDRFLVSAKDIDEAKKIATELWKKEFGDSDLSIVKVMSDSLYKLKYIDTYAEGGMTPLDVSNQIYDITVRIAELGDINTEAAYEETKNLMKMRAALQARALHLQDMEMAKGGYMAKGGATKTYYHILEYHNYGDIGYQGYYDTKEEATKEADRLSKLFPNLDYQVWESDKKTEPPITTLAKGGYMAHGGKLEVGDEGMYEGGEAVILTIDDKSYGYSYLDEDGKPKSQKMFATKSKFENQFRVFPKYAGGGELHRSQEKYAYGRYMAMGGAIEHGLKKGDHIMVVRGNMLGIKNEITGEIVTLNIETGERKESKE